jgi:hypothetical protein
VAAHWERGGGGAEARQALRALDLSANYIKDGGALVRARP